MSQHAVYLQDINSFDAEQSEGDIVILTVSRADVEAHAIGRTVDALLKLTDSEVAFRRYEGRLVILVEGFDDDPRPLNRIPEVRRYIRSLSASWGYFYHYLFHDRSVYEPILTCLIDMDVVTTGGGEVLSALRNPDEARKTLCDLFVPVNRLYERYGLGLDANKAMTKKAVAIIQQVFSF